MVKKSESITALAPALLAAQKEIGVAVKGSENPYFKSKYADLQAVIETVKEPLNNNGIVFLQAVDESIETILLHESGEFISSQTPIFCKKENDPQAFGSGVTYSKRYALQAILGLPTADDDGNAAAKPAKPDEKKPKTQKPAPDANQKMIAVFCKEIVSKQPYYTITCDLDSSDPYKLKLLGKEPTTDQIQGLAIDAFFNLTKELDMKGKTVAGLKKLSALKGERLTRVVVRVNELYDRHILLLDEAKEAQE
ncbi:hypothetical protein LCGC14_2977860 [marine sediment metagenome]|uniref:Essential recombination function protein n=1 Tax=marine sediment metagenome TaxID=412755 RepID=A0A0F8X8B8_9ZZZZ